MYVCICMLIIYHLYRVYKLYKYVYRQQKQHSLSLSPSLSPACAASLLHTVLHLRYPFQRCLHHLQNQKNVFINFLKYYFIFEGEHIS